LIKRYRFLSHEDVVIIPHGYDPEDISNLSNVKPNPSKFIITHSGLFQDNRTPKYFLAALSSFLKKNPEAKPHIEARFVGMMRQSHLKLISKYKLEKNVVATGYLSHDDSLKQIMESDVLWLMLRDTVRSPGKLYEYFGTHKPLLVSVPDGVIARTAQEYRASVVTLPDDINSIESAIRSLYHKWQSGTLPRPDKDFVDQFDRRKLTSDLARELSLVADL
jgi:glycosyltransferase involved in cell wall biosynthesis